MLLFCSNFNILFPFSIQFVHENNDKFNLLIIFIKLIEDFIPFLLKFLFKRNSQYFDYNVKSAVERFKKTCADLSNTGSESAVERYNILYFHI